MAAKKRRSKKAQVKNDLSYETKTILTVILLVTAYPVGLILMYYWMDWPKWLKGVVSLPLIFILLFFGSIFTFVWTMTLGALL